MSLHVSRVRARVYVAYTLHVYVDLVILENLSFKFIILLWNPNKLFSQKKKVLWNKASLQTLYWYITPFMRRYRKGSCDPILIMLCRKISLYF